MLLNYNHSHVAQFIVNNQNPDDLQYLHNKTIEDIANKQDGNEHLSMSHHHHPQKTHLLDLVPTRAFDFAPVSYFILSNMAALEPSMLQQEVTPLLIPAAAQSNINHFYRVKLNHLILSTHTTFENEQQNNQ